MDPYDIYSGEDSYSSNLPMGMGSENIFVSMWPDLLLAGGGSLLEKWGVRHALGKGLFSGQGMLKLGATTREQRLMRLMRGRARGGSPRSILARNANRLMNERRSYVDVPKMRQTKVYAGYANRQPIYKTVNKRVGTSRLVSYGGEAAVVGSNKAHALNRSARAASRRGAGMFQWGSIGKGIGTTLVGMQIAAGMADLAKGLSEAAMDWKPRRDYAPPHEFGHVYYDPRGAFTQRSRAIMAIHDSQLTTRAAIGNESSFMHM